MSRSARESVKLAGQINPQLLTGKLILFPSMAIIPKAPMTKLTLHSIGKALEVNEHTIEHTFQPSVYGRGCYIGFIDLDQ